MSLAEDLRRPYVAANASPSGASVRKHLAQVPTRAAAAETPVPQRESRTEPAPLGALTGPAADASLDALDRASKGVILIMTRYKQLEEHVKQLDAWSKAQIQAAESAAARWQEVAAAAEKQVEDMQKSLQQVTRQAEIVEQSMKRDKQTLTFLQDRIIAAFGFGSEADDALKAIGLD